MRIKYSAAARGIGSSAIREILKVTEQPDVISFAGGIPAPETFPVEAMRVASERLFAGEPRPALQYSATEGYRPLREWVAARHGVAVERVLVTTGSQQALDLIGKALIEPGSPVLVESPTYLGALQSFSFFQAKFVEVPCDEQGMIADAIPADTLSGAHFIYAMPNFQNPTGRQMSLERRQSLVARCREAGCLIVEDDPYGELSYTGTRIATMLSLFDEGVVYLGSFSKVLAPGLRLGYAIGPAELIAKMVQIKQAADLHTATLSQRLAADVLADGVLEQQIPMIRELYGDKCAFILNELEAQMPAGVSWTHPAGGMFVWVEMPAHIDGQELLKASLDGADGGPRVAFVPGKPFFAVNPRANTMRLSFVTVPKEKIRLGIARLARLIAAGEGAVGAKVA